MINQKMRIGQVLRVRFWHNPDKLRGEYLDMYKGV